MRTLLRRFSVVIALMFWQGGFTFYAAVVVPVGQATFSHLEQGFVTRLVTNYLNVAGAVALLILAWDLAESADTSRRRIWCRWLSWAGMLGILLALVWLHPHLDRLLDSRARDYIDEPARDLFVPRHRLYLWLSTAQWLFGIAFVALALWAWHDEDAVVYRTHAKGSDASEGA
jgi:hypothetical protein